MFEHVGGSNSENNRGDLNNLHHVVFAARIEMPHDSKANRSPAVSDFAALVINIETFPLSALKSST